MDDSKRLPTLQAKLLKKTAVFSTIGLLLISVVLPYTIQQRDLEIIRYEMEKRAELIRIGLLSTMMSTGDSTAIRGVVDSYRKFRDVNFNIFRSEYVLAQFGAREGETPPDQNVRNVLAGRTKEYENLSGNTFRYIMPYVSEEKCQRCHRDLKGNPIPVGSILGATEFVFDITKRRNAAFALMGKVMAVVFVLVVALLFGLYKMLAVSVLGPMKGITGNVARLEKEEFDIYCSPQETWEFDVFVRQLKHMAFILGKKKEAAEKELADERKKSEQVRSFAMKQADRLGIKDESEITEIMNRLSHAVKDAEKFEMMAQVCEYVTCEKKNITLSSNVELIMPAALYLTNLATCKNVVKKGATELALEEAIANAMVHGNLEVSSKLKEEDYDKFNAQIAERVKTPPYSNRAVKISYDYSDERAVFTVKDEGDGFDWKTVENRKKEEEYLTYGRGITIMRAFASSIEYSEKGNAVTLTFDMSRDDGR